MICSHHQRKTHLIQNEIVFLDTHFFFLVTETNKLVQAGQYYLVLLKYFLSALIGQSSILSLSPPTVCQKGGVNFSKSNTEGFWVLTTKCRTKPKVYDLQPFECLTQYERLCNSLTLSAKASARGNKFPSQMLIQRQYHWLIWWTRYRFHFDGLIPLGRHVFYKLLNILLMTLLAMRFASARPKTW